MNEQDAELSAWVEPLLWGFLEELMKEEHPHLAEKIDAKKESAI